MADNRKRSPWFSAKAQPPVNGGDYAEYEWRCEHRWLNGRETRTKRALRTVYANCDRCQWRGLLREDESGKSVA